MSAEAFEKGYFAEIYGGNYLRRNPAYKWRAFLKVILRFRREGCLLDVGCALGSFLQHAANHFQCDGSDLSTYALEEARKRLPGNVRLLPGSLGSLPGEAVYDVITCFDVIEHIEDLENVWKNLLTLLKPHGLLVMTVPVYDGPLGKLVDRLDHDPTHIHRRERKFWIKQVESRFRVLDVLGIWRYFLLNRFYLNIVSRSSWRAATALMIVAEKQ
ncbi:MAG: methyltransferase domain-containing protein [Chloroflexi bacterium]|nr:methyltransferase domain-containing protein [Chloroflexota bacterium]